MHLFCLLITLVNIIHVPLYDLVFRFIMGV